MPSLTSQVALLAIASIALAHPNPAAAVVGDGIIATTLGTAIGGALDPIPTNRVGKFDAVDIASPPEFLTIQVVNSHGDAITTSHAHATTGPSAISGNTLPGTIANGATAAFAVPTGWVGNVAINDAGSEITGDDSLIEANFIVPPTGGYTVAVADVDVSYVNGFSAAIVCSCSGVVVSGCNKNLDDLSTCPVRFQISYAYIKPIMWSSHISFTDHPNASISPG